MASATAMMAVTMAATAISTGIGIYSSIQQSQQQQAQAEYQADIARRNADLAEQKASAERRAGYEQAALKRLQTAQLISRQRAQAGASGVEVDSGSFEDIAEATAMSGEMDAINAYNAGVDAAYNAEIGAWNYRNQAEAYDDAAGNAAAGGTLAAIGQGIGGIAQMGSVWNSFRTPASDAAARQKAAGA